MPSFFSMFSSRPLCAKKADMFSLSETNQFYLYTQGADLRKGFNSLPGIIRLYTHQVPHDGSVYIFINRTRTGMKLLHWERGGFVIYHKRFEGGRISPLVFKSDNAFRNVRWDELVLFMEGINPNAKRRKRYNK